MVFWYGILKTCRHNSGRLKKIGARGETVLQILYLPVLDGLPKIVSVTLKVKNAGLFHTQASLSIKKNSFAEQEL